MAKTPKNVPVADGVDFNPVVEQGLAASDLNMTDANCPYAEGDLRAAWLAGLYAVDEPAPIEAPVEASVGLVN